MTVNTKKRRLELIRTADTLHFIITFCIIHIPLERENNLHFLSTSFEMYSEVKYVAQTIHFNSLNMFQC